MELTAKQILESSREIVLKEIEELEEVLERIDMNLSELEKEEGAA